MGFLNPGMSGARPVEAQLIATGIYALHYPHKKIEPGFSQVMVSGFFEAHRAADG
jgi:hypothetical protein